MSALVSILVPAYNAEKWIGETLRSAISQTWEPKEIIVVDDGSTDRTLEVARQFEAEGVRVVSQANMGAAAARNAAFALSSGDFIQWLDADDLLSPDKIALQMTAAEQIGNSRVLLSCGWGRFLYRYHRARFESTSLWCDLAPRDWLVRKMGQNLYMQTATWLVSRELAVVAGPWDTRMLGDDDGEYFCRVLLASERVRFVPDAKVYYRTAGPGSLSYIGGSDKKREAQWLSMQLHMKYLMTIEESEETRAACVTFLQNWMVFFYGERPDIFKKANEKAKFLGGKLSAPMISWKYAWIQLIFGPRIAWMAQGRLSRMKLGVEMFCDKVLYYVDRPSLIST